MRGLDVLLWSLRILVGVLFMFSGLVKAVDPLGFTYKLEEYLEVFGLLVLEPLALPTAVFLCGLEVVLGMALITGWWISATVWILFGLMVFFLILTGYSAITGAVQDCGCFGDAIKLTPWETFIKDVILLGMILPLVIWRHRLQTLPGAGWLVSASALFTGGLMGYALRYLPPLDFRPYHEGANILQQMQLPPGAVPDSFTTFFVYRNLQTGELREFSQEEFMQVYQQLGLMDTTRWEFVESRTVKVREGDQPPITDFALLDPSGQDVTEDVLGYPGYYLFVVLEGERFHMRGLQAILNDLQQLSHSLHIAFLVSLEPDRWETIRKSQNLEGFPYYFVDGVALKTMIRSSPGLVLMRGPVIVRKWAWRSFSAEQVLQEIGNSPRTD